MTLLSGERSMLVRITSCLYLASILSSCVDDTSSSEEFIPPVPPPTQINSEDLDTDTAKDSEDEDSETSTEDPDNDTSTLVAQALTSVQGLWQQPCIVRDDNSSAIYWINWKNDSFTETSEYFYDANCDVSEKKYVNHFARASLTVEGNTGFFKVVATKIKNIEFNLKNPEGVAKELDEPSTAFFKVDGNTYSKGLYDADSQSMKAGFTFDYVKADGVIPERTYMPLPPPEGAIFYAPFEESDLGGFTSKTVTGSISWQTGDFSGRVFAKINGYKQGENESWLISEPISLAGQSEVGLSFDHAFGYTPKSISDEIGVFISTDYTTDPRTATWTELKGYIQPPIKTKGFTEFIESGLIPLNDYIEKTITLGFRYRCTASKAMTWELDNITVFAK